MEKKLTRGLFITFEGPEGCGKSTQVEKLCAWLSEKCVDVVSFRDPGGTVIGERIRSILLDPEHEQMGTRTELWLYMAARSQLWKEEIGPCISAGKCVLMDRWISST